MVHGRLLKGVTPGAAVGADEMGRYLSPYQREALIARLLEDVEARAAAILAEARAAAASMVGAAQAEADVLRSAARMQGFDAGYAAGYAEGQTAGRAEVVGEMQASAALLREAAESAEAARAALLAGAEEQTVSLALAVARHVVGAVAAEHEGLAATLVREGLRACGGRAVRIRTHPDNAETVSSVLVIDGHDLPIHADTAVEVGGCIIDVEGGTVDLRLDSQFSLIHDALLGGH